MWVDSPTTPRRNCRPLARVATSRALRSSASSWGRSEAVMRRSNFLDIQRRTSKLTSRESAQRAELSRLPAIRFDERRSRLRRREQRRRRLPTKPIATGPRFFCACVYTRPFPIALAFKVVASNRKFMFLLRSRHLDAGVLAETSIGDYSDHPPTPVTVRMDGANAIDSRAGVSGDELVENQRRSLHQPARRRANSSRNSSYPLSTGGFTLAAGCAFCAPPAHRILA